MKPGFLRRACAVLGIAAVALGGATQGARAASLDPDSIRAAVHTLSFADDLLQLDESDRAAGEYLRALALLRWTDSPESRRASRGVALSYLRADLPENAVRWMHALERRSADPCLIEATQVPAATAALRLHDTAEARHWLEAPSRCGDSTEDDHRRFLLGIAHVQIGEWRAASQSFATVSPSSPWGSDAARYQTLVMQGAALRRRSPAAAGWLALVPGAGYWYCGLGQTSFAALLVTGIFAEAAREAFRNDQNALGGFLVAFDASWYSGSIYGSVQSAKRLNRFERDQFIQRFAF